MEITAVIAKAAGGLLGFAKSRWRKHRFGTRASLALDWEAQIIFIGGPNTRWRALGVKVTASKDEEFIVASGHLQARRTGRRRWSDSWALAEFLHLPIEIARNREWSGRISGGSVADKLTTSFASHDQIDVRLVLTDLHRAKVISEPLTVTLAELRHEEQW
jgi:hypothetical protein